MEAEGKGKEVIHQPYVLQNIYHFSSGSGRTSEKEWQTIQKICFSTYITKYWEETEDDL